MKHYKSHLQWRHFQLCSGCGICNDICTVNKDNVKRKGSTTSPQQIAKHILSLKKIYGKKSESHKTSITPTFICTGCELCVQACPYYIPFFQNLVEARGWIRYVGTETFPNKLLEMEMDIINVGNPFGNSKEKRDEWVRDDFPTLEKAEVVYFPGCQTAYNLFSIEIAILRILKKSGVTATLPGINDQCCGRFLYFLGSRNQMENAAKSNVEIVNKKSAKILLANCSSCYLAFKKDYPPIVGKLPFRVLHTTEYFNELTKNNKLNFSKSLDKTVIYHDPCELGRIGGVLEAPRELLKSLPGIHLLEFDYNRMDGLCCGGGGLFEAVDEKQAFSIGEDLIKETEQKGVDILVTACPTCNSVFNMSLNNLKQKGELKGNLKIKDIAEVVLKCI
jgi:heterodisulfide reductase subunit D